MKKFLVPLLLILTLTSCGSEPPGRERPDFNIDSVVDIDYIQGDFSADASTGQDGSMTVTVTSPDDLRGITVFCSAEKMTVSYGGLDLVCTDGYYPFTGLYKAVSFARTSVPEKVSADGEECVFEYSCGDERYVFTTLSQTNKIIKIETPVCVYRMK